MLLAVVSAALHAQEPLPAAPARANVPAADEVRISASGTQEREGSVYRLRENVVIETIEMRLEADEVDYDEANNRAEARGHVRYTHFDRHEIVEADRADYDTAEQTGKFYNVRGSAPAKIEAKPGTLTTNSPFSFTCEWAEREKTKYICHNGTVTNCKLPNPWWTLKGSSFDIIPGDRTIARNSVFWLRGLPIFYSPYFYKSLKRAPRKSGFLTPDFGNSSRRGKWLGTGYYWALNRSFDTTYRNQIFTQRGVAHHLDARGKPSRNSEFGYILYGVNDRGLPEDRTIKEGGYLMSFEGRSELPKGFTARADINYLSSFRFRQSWTESFYEAIFQQVQSIGYATRQWSTFTFNGVYQNNDNFLSADPRDRINIRKLPSGEFSSRDRQINSRVLPVWVSFDSSLALLRRNQLAFQTRRFVERLDFYPRITTALRWKDINVVPSFAVRETHWGSSLDEAGQLSGKGLWRNAQELTVDVQLPSLARVYDSKGWLGPKLKHVIEPRAQYRYVSGVGDFNRTIRFDSTELMTDTNQAELGLVNRFYRKRPGGEVDEVISWELAQHRYFDTTFGGAVIAGRPNVTLSGAHLTGFTYFDRPRPYSPIVSRLQLYPSGPLSLEWRADYDPAQGQFANSQINLNARFNGYVASIGHRQLHVPWARANQLDAFVGWGQGNRKGWSAAMYANYDYLVRTLMYSNTQVTYNTDCCGVSFQIRRFNVGVRNETQFRVAFAVANIGSFGTLKAQEVIRF